MRLLWGVVALTSIMRGWFQEISRVTEYYTLVLVSVYCVYAMLYAFRVYIAVILLVMVIIMTIIGGSVHILRSPTYHVRIQQ